MNTILEHFTYHKTRVWDIHEHMETLYEYSKECEHITEMGVRDVVSTWAFLLANPKKLTCYDVQQCPVGEATRLAAETGIQFEFKTADTAADNFVIEETDLLFIDTWHIYEQLRKELALHAKNTRKYIIMHDTTLFGEENCKEFYHCSVKPEGVYTGLWPAVEQFLAENKDWELKERFTNCNGLTILKRVS
jgi:hypothetical protein